MFIKQTFIPYSNAINKDNLYRFEICFIWLMRCPSEHLEEQHNSRHTSHQQGHSTIVFQSPAYTYLYYLLETSKIHYNSFHYSYMKDYFVIYFEYIQYNLYLN